MTLSRTCYIDCTGTFNSGQNTGIQRVVRNIVARSAGLEGMQGYSFVPVISMGSELYELPEDFQGSYPLTRCANRLLGSGWNLLERIFRLGPKGAEALPAAANPVQDRGRRALADRLHQVIIGTCRRALPFFLRIPPLLDTLIASGRRVELQQGDIFFLADSFWNVNSLNAAQKARERRASIVLLIYDIIPITHPQFFDQTTWFLFKDYLPKYLKLADGLIGISRFTRDEVARQCASLGVGGELVLDYAHLGADFHVSPAAGSESSDVVQCIEEGNFIMVGTIEPRKNHLFVLDAFERLWEAGTGARLHIVGRVGWKSDDILKRIAGSKYFNRNLFLYESLNDADLSSLMQRSSAVIIASVVEGFGLPLIEAMHLGKTVLASDIPVFREIGGDFPIYFSLDDDESLMEKIALVTSGTHVNRHPDQQWISWDESVQTMLEKVVHMARATS